MKFGFCRGLDDFDAIKRGKECGADYLETGFGCLANYEEARFLECKALLESINLKCLASNSFIPGDMSLVGEKVDYFAISDYLDRGFDRAEKLGVKTIVLGSGKARSFQEGFPKEKAEEQLIYFLTEYASPRAKKINADIVLEPLRFCETSILHTVSDGVGISEKCKVDNVFTLADLYHVYGNDDSVSGIINFKGKIKHAHVAQPVSRSFPCESDDETVIYIYKEFIRALSLAGCDTCSIEARTEDFNKDVFSAINLLKTL